MPPTHFACLCWRILDATALTNSYLLKLFSKETYNLYILSVNVSDDVNEKLNYTIFGDSLSQILLNSTKKSNLFILLKVCGWIIGDGLTSRRMGGGDYRKLFHLPSQQLVLHENYSSNWFLIHSLILYSVIFFFSSSFYPSFPIMTLITILS